MMDRKVRREKEKEEIKRRILKNGRARPRSFSECCPKFEPDAAGGGRGGGKGCCCFEIDVHVSYLSLREKDREKRKSCSG